MPNLTEIKTADLLEELTRRQETQIIVVALPAQAEKTIPQAETPLWLNKKEACAHLKRSYYTLMKYISAGLIEVEGEGRSMMVNVSSFGQMPKRKRLRAI